MALLVGSLSILNIGLSTIHERPEEVALRRALGASRARVAAVLVLESQFVALIAAVSAVALAVAVTPATLHQLTAVPVAEQALPLSSVAMGVGASMLAAPAGSLAPSIKAARATIASLLR